MTADMFEIRGDRSPEPSPAHLVYTGTETGRIFTSYSDLELVTMAESLPACQHPLVQEILTRLARRAGHLLGHRDLRSRVQREAQQGGSSVR